MTDISIFPDPEQLARGAADHIIALATEAITASGHFTIALSGGATPRATYALLGQQYNSAIDWGRVLFFWGDERTVPPDHPESDYGMAYQDLLQHLMPPLNVYRIKGEVDPERAARQYEDLLLEYVGNPPRFDLVLLGIGDDGHTASLFPHTTALYEPERWCVANRVDKLDTWRVTLTARAINNAANVTFIVAGQRKAAALRDILEGEHRPEDLPAQMISPEQGKLRWFLDAPAASLLQK